MIKGPLPDYQIFKTLNFKIERRISMNEFEEISQELIKLIDAWEPILSHLPKDMLTERKKTAKAGQLSRFWDI